MNKLQRVNRSNRCPVCNHDSWCLVGESVALCMRVSSDKEKEFSNGDVGWLHNMGKDFVPPPQAPKQKEETKDFRGLIAQWDKETTTYQREQFAKYLGVSLDSLLLLDVVHSAERRAWGFPMRNSLGNVTGMRLRLEDGRKISVKGSKEGVFVPSHNTDFGGTALICEGPTDTAAALTLGYFSIGRPSCSGGMWHIKEMLKAMKISRVIIVADNDNPLLRNDNRNPGIEGALRLSKELPMRNCIVALPCNDLRSFVRIGGTRTDLEEIVSTLVWR